MSALAVCAALVLLMCSSVTGAAERPVRGASASLPAQPAGFSTVWYFAEGCTRAGFHEYLTLANPTDAAAGVQVLYVFSDGSWNSPSSLTIPARSRSTVDVNSAVGEGKDVSIRVASDQSIVAERPMYFDYHGWTGGHDVTGAARSARLWQFAEGYTGEGFEEWVCVLNLSDTPANLTFRFQTQESGEVVKTGQAVGAHSRASFKVNDLLGGGYQSSLTLESDQPVVAERPMYFDYRGAGAHHWTGGHCAVGATSLSNEYYFGEGTTREGFEEWLTLQNPGASPITVTASYQFGRGQGDPLSRSYEVAAGHRLTVNVKGEVGAGKDVSVRLSCPSGFLAERPMYFDSAGRDGGHVVVGATAPREAWYFAEGYTGEGFDEWLCLSNPGASTAQVEVSYYTQEAGALEARTLSIPAATRATVHVNADAGGGFQLSCSVRVLQGPAIVAERPMYFDYHGWTGGHDVMGQAQDGRFYDTGSPRTTDLWVSAASGDDGADGSAGHRSCR